MAIRNYFPVKSVEDALQQMFWKGMDQYVENSSTKSVNLSIP
ncbi:hypothetical protein MC885_015331 [Smutsia gigantea]|nr:hypothetical protein MC885_015331 [Smutsia gigantea]